MVSAGRIARDWRLYAAAGVAWASVALAAPNPERPKPSPANQAQATASDQGASDATPPADAIASNAESDSQSDANGGGSPDKPPQKPHPDPIRATDWIMAGSAALTALFTAILTGSTILLWRETKRLAGGAETQHAEVNRAFVFMNGFSVAEVNEHLPASDRIMELSWKNSGHMPTVGAVIQTNFGFYESELNDAFQYPYREGGKQIVFVGPGAEIVAGQLRFHCVDYERALAKEIHLYVWGRVDYRDALRPNEPRYTRFCMKLDYVSQGEGTAWQGFPLWGPYNGSDQDT